MADLVGLVGALAHQITLCFLVCRYYEGIGITNDEIVWPDTDEENEETEKASESHDQALVGDKTIIFRLLDKEMYDSMNLGSNSFIVE